MAISAVGGLLSSVAGGTAGGFLISAGLTSSVFMANFLTATALGALSGILGGKPSGSSSKRGYQVNSRGSALEHPVIYGETKVGGVVVFDGTTGTNNKYLHRVIAVAGHEVDSYSELYVNDSRVTDLEVDGNVKEVTDADGNTSNRYDGKLRINKHLGSPDQLADSDLVSEYPDWTSAHRLRGIAYLYVRFSFDSGSYPNGLPDITTKVKGKKVYDPRTTTTVWSDNPALCIRDYLTSSYGLNEDSANINDDSITIAANVCDYKNYPTLTGDPKFTCNGSFTTAVTPYDMLQALSTSMVGLIWYTQGEWNIKAAHWVEPTITLTEDDLRSNVAVRTRHSRRDNFNIVKGTFRGEETNWQVTDYPEVTDTAFVSADNGQESTTDLDLSFTSDSEIAQQIALITLERNRQQVTITASFGLNAMQLSVGENVKITLGRYGWVDKYFEVTDWTFGFVNGLDLQVQMTLRETSESVFDNITNAAVYETDNSLLTSPFVVPAVGVAASAEAKVSNQKVSNIGVVVITSSSPESVDYVDVDYKLSSESEWSSFGQGNLGKFSVRDLEIDFYDFRSRAINTFGIKGDYTYLYNVEINAFIGDPSDVTNFDRSISGGTLFLSWDAISDADLSHYQIKKNSNTTGATWGNSSTLVSKIARPATSVSVPAGSGTYLIRAYDKEDNFSVNTTELVVLPSELPSLGQIITQDEGAETFLGSLTNVSRDVSGAFIEIDDTDSEGSEGTYLFADHIDSGSVRTCRVTGYSTFTRHIDNTGSNNWDDIPQLWDTWPDNWDTWTDDSANFGDIAVDVYVRPTDDDPAGTPTWGAWTLVDGSDILARAFEFKAVLTSTSRHITPQVTELSATVEF